MRLIPKSRRGRNELDGLWALTARGLTRYRPTGAPTSTGLLAYRAGGTVDPPPSTNSYPQILILLLLHLFLLSLLFFHHLHAISWILYRRLLTLHPTSTGSILTQSLYWSKRDRWWRWCQIQLPFFGNFITGLRLGCDR